MAEAGDKKRGLSSDDKWFDGLRDLGTEVIVDTFDLEGVKEQVRQNVEDCMQQADVTSCLEGKVDAVSDGLGDKVSKPDRDDAKNQTIYRRLIILFSCLQPQPFV
jgi:hypothetical protein